MGQSCAAGLCCNQWKTHFQIWILSRPAEMECLPLQIGHFPGAEALR